MIKVVLADDQVLLRESLKYILENEAEIKIIGSVGTGKEVLELCAISTPDIILMDIKMPDLDGVSATKIIKEKYPNVRIIMLTTFENAANIITSFKSGADGYIVKDIEPKNLVLSIKCVYGGMHVMHENVKKFVVEKLEELTLDKRKYQGKITKEERELIKLMANGSSNKEISKALSFAEGTVRNKISKLYDKLEISDRTQIVIFAIENGII